MRGLYSLFNVIIVEGLGFTGKIMFMWRFLFVAWPLVFTSKGFLSLLFYLLWDPTSLCFHRRGKKGRKEIKCKIELSLIEYAVNLVWSFCDFDIFWFFVSMLFFTCMFRVSQVRLVLYTSKLSKCDVNDFVQFTCLEFL